MRITNPKDVYSGAFFVAIGVVAFFWARTYAVGTLLNMGPGYFPALIGVVLVLLGAGTFVSGLRKATDDPILPLDVTPLFLVLAGVLSFAFLVERAGLIVAIAALIFFACFRRLLTNPIEVIITYLVLAGFSAVVFVDGLGLPIPLFWWDS